MIVKANLAPVRSVHLRDLVLRFFFGGVATVVTGLIAHRFGPVVGGLFLAFPAIFPASISLIESHEIEQKRKIGADGRLRGRIAASMDAAGAVLGCIGLAVFALFLWRALPHYHPALLLPIDILIWLMLSGSLWLLRHRLRHLHPRRRRLPPTVPSHPRSG